MYGVVKDHKGYYDVISELGKGTAFVLYFPVSEAAAENQAKQTIDLKGSETVLVVDDDDSQREMAFELLSSYGYQVSLAAHGHEALTFLAGNSVDIVILDMIMENGFDGLDTFREIVKMKPGQKAIIVSGYSPTERVQEMQNLGAGQYVRKPYTRQTLATAIRAELSRPAGSQLAESMKTKVLS